MALELKDYIERIKYELTGNRLILEISDDDIGLSVKYALKDMQRYINEVRYIEVDYKRCIDLKDLDFYTITKIYRTKPIGAVANYKDVTDPMYLQFWNSFGFGTNYNLNKYIMDYASYSKLQQIRSTMSTDLSFMVDKARKQLFINCATGTPSRVVIEYIPIFKDVNEVLDEYWQNIIFRYALAKTKIVLGRMRTRMTYSSSLISQDGDTILDEGQRELDNILEFLETNTEMEYPID